MRSWLDLKSACIMLGMWERHIEIVFGDVWILDLTPDLLDWGKSFPLAFSISSLTIRAEQVIAGWPPNLRSGQELQNITSDFRPSLQSLPLQNRKIGSPCRPRKKEFRSALYFAFRLRSSPFSSVRESAVCPNLEGYPLHGLEVLPTHPQVIQLPVRNAISIYLGEQLQSHRPLLPPPYTPPFDDVNTAARSSPSVST